MDHYTTPSRAAAPPQNFDYYSKEEIDIEKIFIFVYCLLLSINFFIIVMIFSYIFNINENIEDIEYQRQKIKKNYTNKYQEVILEEPKKILCHDENTYNYVHENDDKEAIWKRRILMEYIEGQGNIIMFYDFYRRGFCYYSDISSIPYSDLIEIAYKYAFVYKCISFIMYENGDDYGGGGGDGGAAKLPTKKNTYLVNSLETKMRGGGGNTPVLKGEPKEEDTKKMCVKMIRMGKICDFLFLSKTTTTTTKSTKAEENNAVKSVTYKEFISQHRRQEGKQD